MRFVLVCLVLAGFSEAAVAGAWEREKGKYFLSTSLSVLVPLGNLTADPEAFGSFYLERGLGRRLTFGLDAGMEQTGSHTAIAFLRRSLGAPDTVHKFAVQAGLGIGQDSAAQDYLLQVGASWGRGLTTSIGRGWLALDTSVIYKLQRQDYAIKADLTVGIKPTERMKWILQLQAGDYPGSAPYLRVAPSVARKFGERAHVELGAQIGVAGDDRVGLKLGTWLEF